MNPSVGLSSAHLLMGLATATNSKSSQQQPPLKPFIKGERRYPCGFPGCKWIFTRSNHVLRHHQRVHPGYKPAETSSAIPTTKTSCESKIQLEGNLLAGNPVVTAFRQVLPKTSVFKCDMPDCSETFKTP